MKAIPEMRRTH